AARSASLLRRRRRLPAGGRAGAVSQFYPFLIVGLVAGSIYGMTAVGLVLTYRTSGIFNFAHGAIAAANAFLFYELREEWGLAWPLAGLLCLVVLAPAMGFVLERMAK